MTNGLIAVADWWQDWANVAQVIGFPLAVAALAMAWWQLRKAARAARGEFLLAIDAALAEPELQNLRTQIYKTERPWTVPDEASERNKVRRYIAVFERLGILLRDRSVSIRHVDQLYGDRIAAITNNKSVRELVLDSPDAWRDFLYLWKRIQKRRDRRGKGAMLYTLRTGKKEAKTRKEAGATVEHETQDRFEAEEDETSPSAGATPDDGAAPEATPPT
jgi:hypothetical protein